MTAQGENSTPKLYLYEDTCSGGYFLTAEKSNTTLHRFVQEVAMPRDALNAAHQTGVSAEQARAAAEVTEEWGVENRYGLSAQPSEETARERLANGAYEPRIVRRAVGPWEVQ